MATLLIFISVVVAGVLFAYGLHKPEAGSGNLPAEWAVKLLRDNGSPPTSK